MSKKQSVATSFMGLKVGDKCFVVRNGPDAAVISKIGRRWITATLRSGRGYEFDKDTGQAKGAFFGYAPMLQTMEQVDLLQARTAARDAVSDLGRFVNKCSDQTLLKLIVSTAAGWCGK